MGIPHKAGPGRQGCFGPILSGSQRHAEIIHTKPSSGGDLGGKTHKPGVTPALGGSRFPGGRAVKIVFPADAAPRSPVHHRLHQAGHKIGRLFAQYFLPFRIIFFQDIAVAVLDAGNGKWPGVYTFVGQGGIGSHNFYRVHF